MKKLTKEKALEITEELWSWLAVNPDKKKEDWPGWEKYGEMMGNCPCCEFTCYYCKKCPLLKFWIETAPSVKLPYSAPCVDGIYGKYNHSKRRNDSDIEYNKHIASRIAQAARKELNKLKEIND